jgi:uncharacterized protein YuzE
MSRQPAPFARYSRDDDILYVRLRDLPIARTGETNPWTNIDLAADGRVVAVEFVNVASEGVDLTGVPEREAVERLIRESGLRLPAQIRGS